MEKEKNIAAVNDAIGHHLQRKQKQEAYDREALEIMKEGEDTGLENKEEIVLRLKLLLMVTRAGSDIADLALDEDQKKVSIVFKTGYRREANIEGDSGIAIIKDVMKFL